MASLPGAAVVARMLEGYGVTHVFFVPTILTHTLVEIERRAAIDRILVHSEKAAAYMADGYARASGRPGVCLAQAVGAANLASGLRDARLTASPIVAITGGPFKHSRERFQYQEIEDRPMFAPVTKSSVRVEDVDRLPGVIRHAFQTATSGRPGPAHVELEGHYADVLELQSTEQGPDVDARHGRLPPYRPAPDSSETLAAARLLASAQRPVIIAGGGVRLSSARAALRQFAERFGVPVAASLSGKDAIPAGHPLSVGVTGLYSRECANRIVGDADVALFLGTKAGSQSTHNWQLPDVTRTIIHCDIDPEVIGVNYVTSAALVGDVAVTLDRLSDVMADLDQADRSSWLGHVRTTVTSWYEANADVRRTRRTPIRPERLCSELSSGLPKDALVVADTGHAGMWSAAFLDLRSPDQSFIRAAGSLGWALPAAIGGQCALPDRPVVAFTGDGGLWYHLSELETAARWNIPIKVIVNNNNSLNQEIDIYRAAYGGELRGRHGELWRFREVDFAAIAREMGVQSVRVEVPDELGEALARAWRSERPFLVDVVTDADVTAPLAYLPERAAD